MSSERRTLGEALIPPAQIGQFGTALDIEIEPTICINAEGNVCECEAVSREKRPLSQALIEDTKASASMLRQNGLVFRVSLSGPRADQRDVKGRYGWT